MKSILSHHRFQEADHQHSDPQRLNLYKFQTSTTLSMSSGMPDLLGPLIRLLLIGSLVNTDILLFIDNFTIKESASFMSRVFLSPILIKLLLTVSLVNTGILFFIDYFTVEECANFMRRNFLSYVPTRAGWLKINGFSNFGSGPILLSSTCEIHSALRVCPGCLYHRKLRSFILKEFRECLDDEEAYAQSGGAMSIFVAFEGNGKVKMFVGPDNSELFPLMTPCRWTGLCKKCREA